MVICVCDAMSGDGFDEAMDLLDRWIRGWSGGRGEGDGCGACRMAYFGCLVRVSVGTSLVSRV